MPKHKLPQSIKYVKCNLCQTVNKGLSTTYYSQKFMSLSTDFAFDRLNGSLNLRFVDQLEFFNFLLKPFHQFIQAKANQFNLNSSYWSYDNYKKSYSNWATLGFDLIKLF